MTPRSLMTAIATTAIGFVLIISSVAGSTLGASAQPGQSLTAISSQNIHLQPYHTLATDGETSSRLLAWNGPCEIAL